MVDYGNIVLLPEFVRPMSIKSFCDSNWKKKLRSILGPPTYRVKIEFPGIEDPLYYGFTPKPRIPNLIINGQIIYGPIMIVRFDDEGKHPEDIPSEVLVTYKELLMPCLLENEFRKNKKRTTRAATIRKEW